LVLRARTFHRCNFCVPVRRELLAAASLKSVLGPSDCHLEYVRVPRFIRDDYPLGEAMRRAKAKQERTEEACARAKPVAPCPPGPHARGGTEIGTDCGAGPADRSGQRRIFVRTPDEKISYWNKAPKGSTVGPPPKPSVGHRMSCCIRYFPFRFPRLSKRTLGRRDLHTSGRHANHACQPLDTLRNNQGELTVGRNQYRHLGTQASEDAPQAQRPHSQLAGRKRAGLHGNCTTVSVNTHIAKINLDLLASGVRQAEAKLVWMRRNVSQCLTETRTLDALPTRPLRYQHAPARILPHRARLMAIRR